MNTENKQAWTWVWCKGREEYKVFCMDLVTFKQVAIHGYYKDRQESYDMVAKLNDGEPKGV